MDEYTIEVVWDEEGRAWCADNFEIPISTWAATLDKLVERVRVAVPDVLEANGKSADVRLRFVIEPVTAVRLEADLAVKTAA
jgi:hypothetical protein